MNKEWSLDALYKGYDEEFKQDFDALLKQSEEMKKFTDSLASKTEEDAVVSMIAMQEEFRVRMRRLGSFISLKKSTNTTDSETISWANKIDQAFSELIETFTKMDAYLVQVTSLNEIMEKHPDLKEYTFYFDELKKKAAHKLSPEEESIIGKMNLSGASAWAMQWQYLTSTLKVDYKGEKLTLAGIRNLAYDKDPAVRKEAYEAEIAAYDKIKDGAAFALNNIKAESATIAKLKNYDSPLDMALKNSRMTRKTLDAMFEAMREYLPKFHAYLRAKAELLGYENGLPWYELFAPVGESGKTYTTEEAKTYLVEHFKGFSQELADMITRAFDEAWIDFYPHDGKVGGAFCSNLPFIGQSRILTNFDGSFSDVVTLAHELGHAFHGQQIQDHRPLNTAYTMPVAETASTFNETVIMNAAISEAEGMEKLVLIESQLQDVTQIICDIYSRFLFEDSVFEKRKDSFMFSNTLCELMTDAQKAAYGDGLDPSQMNPYMWVCKSHYYRTDLNYYNYPYAFGGLFARGLYVRYLEEGEKFLPKYKELLRATTVSSVEEVAAMAGIDITDPSFWRSSLQSYAELIDIFIGLCKECK
ncbi:MAG: M3 family oligoendopeptidase [Lachnospiraceae bacterium]|nr:M3 family oligoendopeptidase [Lachnospiraceae bacterium]